MTRARQHDRRQWRLPLRLIVELNFANNNPSAGISPSPHELEKKGRQDSVFSSGDKTTFRGTRFDVALLQFLTLWSCSSPTPCPSQMCISQIRHTCSCVLWSNLPGVSYFIRPSVPLAVELVGFEPICMSKFERSSCVTYYFFV